MTAAVSAIVLAVGLLSIVVVDLLRQHGRILRTLHAFDGGEVNLAGSRSSPTARNP